MISVTVHLKEQSQPITYKDVVNTYEKGPWYCIYRSDERVFKYPISNIWRVIEDYGEHGK